MPSPIPGLSLGDLALALLGGRGGAGSPFRPATPACGGKWSTATGVRTFRATLVCTGVQHHRKHTSPTHTCTSTTPPQP
eukprot:8847084-Alexandrium_andersonii.AAC.1